MGIQDRLQGYSSRVAVKAPCRVATTANITLAGFQTVDGVVLGEDDANLRVLVKDQTDARQNGIYDASSGLWQRSPDFNGNNDFVQGTRVFVLAGSTSAGEYVVSSSDPIVVGTSNITFTGGGNIIGPNVAVNGNIPLFDGTTGRLLKDSGIRILDEDDMASNSATAVPTQQSTKAYVDEVHTLGTTLQVGEEINWAGGDELPLPLPALVNPATHRWSIFDFDGALTQRALATGVADYQAVLTNALLSGENIWFPKWEYPIRSLSEAGKAVAVVAAVPIDVDCARGAKFIVGDEISAESAGLFSLRAGAVEPTTAIQIPFRWHGGIFDGSEVTNATSPGIGMLDVFWYTGAVISDVVFYSGTATPTGSNLGWGMIDSAIVTHSCFGVLIDNCDFTGFIDLGIYLSGDNDAQTYSGIGEANVVRACRFRRCNAAIGAKRQARANFFLNNFMYECGNGIQAGSADALTDNHGKRFIIIGNRMKFMQGRPIYMEGGADNVVQGNSIVDFAKQVSDGTTFTTVASGNRIAGVDGRGVSFSTISDNVIRQDAWAGGSADANKEPVGIQLMVDTDGNGAFDNLIHHNQIRSVHRSMLEGSVCDRNRFEDNIVTLPGSGTSLGRSLSGASTVYAAPAEPGTFTPVLAGSSGDASAYDLQEGRYWRRGQDVVFQIYIDLSATTGLSGNVSITGLPFTPISTPTTKSFVFGHNTNVTHSGATYTGFVAEMSGSSAALLLFEEGSGTKLQLAAASFGANSRISVCGSYLTSAD